MKPKHSLSFKGNKLILLFCLVVCLIAITGAITGGFIILPIYDFASPACKESNVSIKVLFCPEDNCFNALQKLFSSSNKTRCAFYDMDRSIWEKLMKDKKAKTRNTKIIMEDKNCPMYFMRNEEISCPYSKALMHNKFCVFDDKVVLSGSANPTENGLFKNNNNIILINSSCVAKAFLDEYEELNKGVFGGGKKSKKRMLKIGKATILEWYFCPEDKCRERIIKAIKTAKREICFSLFALTDDALTKELLRLNSEGIKVYGTIEKQNRHIKGSEYDILSQKLDIRLDRNKHAMHNKFFVIDDKTVITGSANPTKNGFERNDENVIVLHNFMLAQLYMRECRKIFGDAKS